MKISILIKKKYENIDFGQNWRKITKIDQNWRKISILVKIFENSGFWLKLTKMSILVEIEENDDFNQNFRKSGFGQNYWKILVWVKMI